MESLLVVVRRVPVEELYDLRMSVLIVGTKRTSPRFVGDQEPEALHLGAFDGEKLIGCASFIPSEWEGKPAWQLRGMATHPDYRGMGIGKAILAHAEAALVNRDRPILWCNARTPAVGFYVKQGWERVSDEYIIAEVGPHYRLIKRLGELNTE